MPWRGACATCRALRPRTPTVSPTRPGRSARLRVTPPAGPSGAGAA
jgi:hypothetical protein